MLCLCLRLSAASRASRLGACLLSALQHDAPQMGEDSRARPLGGVRLKVWQLLLLAPRRRLASRHLPLAPLVYYVGEYNR